MNRLLVIMLFLAIVPFSYRISSAEGDMWQYRDSVPAPQEQKPCPDEEILLFIPPNSLIMTPLGFAVLLPKGYISEAADLGSEMEEEKDEEKADRPNDDVLTPISKQFGVCNIQSGS